MDLPRRGEPTSAVVDIARGAIDEVLPALSADHDDGVLDRLQAASQLRNAVDELLTALVLQARNDGATWAEVGARLGVSTQAAHQKYRHLAAVAAARRHG